VKTSVARELVVFLRKNGPPPLEGTGAASTLAEKHGTNDVLVAKQERRDAIVAAVDPRKREVTLKFTDGTSKTFPLRKDVDAGELHAGDDVVIQTGAAVTLKVEKR
jgi:hypothetical protein